MRTPEPGDDHGGHDDSRFVAELRAALSTATAAHLIETSSPPDQLLELIVRSAARAIPSPEGALFLIDHERQVLTFDIVIGSTAANVRDLTVPLGHGIAGLVAVSGQALAVAMPGKTHVMRETWPRNQATCRQPSWRSRS